LPAGITNDANGFFSCKMKTFKYSVNENDKKLADFARALALPVRVQIIRYIVENGFTVNKEELDFTGTSREAVTKHISELRTLGIIQMEGQRGNITYHIDQKWFTEMITDFSAVFGVNTFALPTSYVNMPLNQNVNDTGKEELTPHPSFGAFIKKHREELNISQEIFAQKIEVDRSQLSRIECGKVSINPGKLKEVAKALYISYPIIKKEYYSYQLAEIIDEGGYDESMLASAREKLGYVSQRKK
jgi:transcriptional regulator with XRE-family HTH domain